MSRRASDRRRGSRIPSRYLLAAQLAWLFLAAPGARADSTTTVPPESVAMVPPDSTLLWWPVLAPAKSWAPVAALWLPTDEVLVADKQQNRLYLIQGGATAPVRLPEPSPPPVEWTALSSAPGLALYALDGPGGTVHQFDLKGNYLGVAIKLEDVVLQNDLGRVDAYGLAVDRSGRAVITDRQNDRVLLFGPGWSFLGVLGESGSTVGAWRRPGAATASDNGLFLIVDEGNRRVVLLDAVGSVKAVHATKDIPRGVAAIDADRFAMTLDNRVEVLDTDLNPRGTYAVPAGPRCGGASYATSAVSGKRDRILVGEGCSGRLLELRIRGD